MKIKLISFKIASWALLLGGIFHSLSDILSPMTPERIEIMTKMRSLSSHVLGTEFNMLSFFKGFSFMMGLLTFGYGALNVVIVKSFKNTDIPNRILILNTIITLMCLVISVKYFFLIPIILTAIPFIGFSISLLTKNR